MSPVSRLGHPRFALRGFTALCLAGALVAVGGAAAASPPPSPTAEPQVQAKDGASVELPEMKNWSWMLADAQTGDVLAGREWHWQLPTASTMKALTALTLVNRLDMNSPYRAQPSDAEAEGSKVGIKAGSTYTVRDLFNGMLMPSGNDAAQAVANAYGGVQRTTEAMNEEARRIGARDTVAKNASGLDEDGQVSSAYDLALVMRESLKNDTLREIYGQHETQFPAEEPKEPGQERKQFTIWTENRLILNYYDGAIGGKTGFTQQAGRTYVGAVERNGRTLIAVILRSAESTERALHRIFDWGFENADKIEPIDHLVDPEAAPEITAQQAVSYDENGGSNIDQVATTDVSATSDADSSRASPIFFFAIVLGGAAIVIIVRRRRAVANAKSVRAQKNDVDLRERDHSNLS